MDSLVASSYIYTKFNVTNTHIQQKYFPDSYKESSRSEILIKEVLPFGHNTQNLGGASQHASSLYFYPTISQLSSLNTNCFLSTPRKGRKYSAIL